MCRLYLHVAVAAAIALLGYQGAVANPRATRIDGTFNEPQENGCVIVSAFYFRVDCSYTNRWPELGGSPIPWVGPTISAVYYPSASSHATPRYTPQPGDDRIPLTMSGTVTIDDLDTEGAEDDRISMEITVGPAARNGQTRGGRGAPLARIVESWSLITHRMLPMRVDSAVQRSDGGWDYVIGAKGFPERLCAVGKDAGCFPSPAAPALAEGKWAAGFWAKPAAMGVARSPVLDANPGAATIVEMEGYKCQSLVSEEACSLGVGLLGGLQGGGLSNLLLRVSTDSKQQVRAVAGFWTVEYRLNAGPAEIRGGSGEPNSWLGGYLEARRSTAE